MNRIWLSTLQWWMTFGLILALGCSQTVENTSMETEKQVTASDILGNPEYRAISYGGYRTNTREEQPTVEQLKDDMRILYAMGIRVLRTYNVKFAHASNVLKAIRELRQEQPNFEMYVMLGAWIDCLNAWTGLEPDHHQESPENVNEIGRAVKLANEYPEIVKVIAVGNEAMVKWAASYYVQPGVILKWVSYLQELKQTGGLPEELWITSSDNFASWGGGESEYHVEDLNDLIQAVDFISMHTYPMHDTHYNPTFWGLTEDELSLSKEEQVFALMTRSVNYARSQYESVKAYMEGLGVQKPIHIGETGWASASNGLYGPKGSKATDEYKEGVYRERMRAWTEEAGLSCFYFQAFDEPWKDAGNPGGSENYFGLFTVDGQAKYALWSLVDNGTFDGLTRDGVAITKTYEGDKESLMEDVLLPPLKEALVPSD